jgi:alpha-1,6-mannosyltransferase
VATYPLASVGLPAGVWILKLSTAAASLGCAGLVAACARRLGRPPGFCALAVALNPLVLVYGVGGVHNDFFMMLLLLAGLFWLLSAREGKGGAVLVASIAVKAAAIPIAPFLLLVARRGARAVVAAAIAAIALVGLTILVFGARLPGLADQANAITSFSLPDDVASIFGVSPTVRCAGHKYSCLNTTIAVVFFAGFAVAFAVLVWRAWRGADPIVCAGWAGVALVLTLSSVMPWYVLWILPLAVLSRSRSLQATTAVLAVLLLFTSQPMSHLLLYGA